MPRTAQTTTQPEALSRLLDQVLAGADVVLFTDGDNGRLLLDMAAERLAELRTRVLRIAEIPPGGLSLSLLIAQVAGQPDLNAQDDESLKRGFQALTVLDKTCDRIVLMVSDAHALHRAALRYLQFACRAGTNLQFVLAGRREFLDLLNADEFSHLRRRLTAPPKLTLPSAAPGPGLDVPLTPRLVRTAPAGYRAETPRAALSASRTAVFASAPDRNWRRVALAGIGLGAAAAIMLSTWIGWIGWPAKSSQQAVLAARSLTAPEASPSDLLRGAASRIASGTAPVVTEAPDLQTSTSMGNAGAPAAALSFGASAAPALKTAPDYAGTASAPAKIAVPMSKETEMRSNDSPRPSQSTGRRSTPAQPRLAAAPAGHARSSGEWEEPYFRPSDGRSLPPPQTTFRAGDQAIGRPQQSYIGTYTTDANGVRVFHFGP